MRNSEKKKERGREKRREEDEASKMYFKGCGSSIMMDIHEQESILLIFFQGGFERKREREKKRERDLFSIHSN